MHSAAQEKPDLTGTPTEVPLVPLINAGFLGVRETELPVLFVLGCDGVLACLPRRHFPLVLLANRAR